MTKRIGITGGIGSGKTTVCRLFEVLGIPVYYADDRAKWLMNHDDQLKQQIVAAFGPGTYNEQGELNRPYLAGIVFQDAAQLAVLNGIVHPAVARDTLVWETAHQTSPYTLREAALLYETGSYRLLDKVIVVTAPLALRIARVMARDGIAAAEVKARIDQQWPEDQKVERADYVICNDQQHSLIHQVYTIHQSLLELP
ncbi:MAG: dephospho-CoA kinase [Bacteroidetes bacterium]|nr:MAG: dephospho-CoA kinase [Bacteroidota bacterium]PTM14207.1 MAG: dephospho-CoA kinase [Bacteroidota bacterium]